MNNVLLTGHLTRDAELLDINNGERKAIKFTLAVRKRYKNTSDEKDADYIPVIYFTNYSHKLVNYLTKGILVSVSGKISVRSIEEKEGTRRYFTNIIANNIDFLGSNKSKAL